MTGLFLEQSLLMGLEYHNLYYGTYRCKVLDNKDPLELGRITVGSFAFGSSSDTDQIGGWVEPVSPFKGWFSPPEVGEEVWVRFENGNANKPQHYIGLTAPFTPDKISEFAYVNGRPTVRGVVTRLGHRIVWSDEPGNEFVRIICHKPDSSDAALKDPSKYSGRVKGKVSMLSFEPNGDVLLVNQAGANIYMNATDNAVTIAVKQGSKSNVISMTEQGITMIDGSGKNMISMVGGDINLACENTVTISAKTLNVKTGSTYLGKGADASLIRGEDFLVWAKTHIHPTGVGPSMPATPQPVDPVVLSQTGKLK